MSSTPATGGTPTAPPSPTPLAPGATGPDRLVAEVRESLVLLLMSVLVTAGVAGAASAIVTLLS